MLLFICRIKQHYTQGESYDQTILMTFALLIAVILLFPMRKNRKPN